MLAGGSVCSITSSGAILFIGRRRIVSRRSGVHRYLGYEEVDLGITDRVQEAQTLMTIDILNNMYVSIAALNRSFYSDNRPVHPNSVLKKNLITERYTFCGRSRGNNNRGSYSWCEQTHRE